MDFLSTALSSLRIVSSAIGQFCLTEPWGLAVDYDPAYCCCVIEGSFWLFREGYDDVQLGPGDSVLMPRGGPCRLACDPSAEFADLSKIWQSPVFEATDSLSVPFLLEWGGGGSKSRILGLAFGLGDSRQSPLLSGLPDSILLRSAENGLHPWLQPAIDFLTQEQSGGKIGYPAIAARLVELIFLTVIRSHALLTPEATKGWLCGLSDPRIAQALSAIHADPGRRWTVGTLAAEACMSRSAFSARFLQRVGQPPGEYVTKWRMYLAAQKLTDCEMSVGTMAAEFGYLSERAFRQAFQNCHGSNPSAFRRAGGQNGTGKPS